MLAAPSAASARETGENHKHSDASASKTPQEERALTRQTQTETADDAQAAAAAVPGAPDDVGTWSAPVDWPVIGVHVALLPNGKVLAWDSLADWARDHGGAHDHSRVTVWDPVTGAHSDAPINTGFNIFCAGLAHLADGSLFLAGGNKNPALDGIRQTHVFNHASNTWSRNADMAYERWYPTVTTMPNGEMLITGGLDFTDDPAIPDVPEVRQRDGSNRVLSTAERKLYGYPWIDVAPDGRAFYSGPSPHMRALDTDGTGSWQSYAQRDTINRSYGGHAVYDVGKILVAGGGHPVDSGARVIDLNGASPAVSPTGPMAIARRQHNLTLLADGTALATGGHSGSDYFVDLDNGVYAAELWNPATGTWKTLAAQRVTRQYHSTALLLPDGRVLSSGGGNCGRCDQVGYLAKNAEVFTPPYLYKKDGSGQLAPRPQITAAPASLEHGRPFEIATPDAGSIVKAGLVRLGGVTHSVDMDQRYVPLTFTRGSGTLTAIGPPNPNIAPPGPYMLFIVNAAGVPSVARMVTVPIAGGTAPPATTAPTAGGTAPPATTAPTAGGTAPPATTAPSTGSASGAATPMPPAPQAAPPPVPPRDTTSPSLSALSLSPNRFATARRGASIVARGRARSTISYKLSEPARVIFSVQRASTGRRAGGRCVKAKRANRRAKRCIRYNTLAGRFTHRGSAGRNSLKFSGRLRNRKLAPGRYGLRAISTDVAGNRSRPKRSHFTILRR